MRNLVIDIGNTAAKYGLFEEDRLVKHGSVPSAAALGEAVSSFGAEQVLLASVAGATGVFKDVLPPAAEVLEFSPLMPLPITNAYGTPETLGADRLAGAVGAAFLFPGRHCLVIDAGTAITFDFIDKNKHYHGGSISPGLSMKLKALHTFTGRLPLTEQAAHAPLIGSNTRESIQSGVMNGTVAELEGMVRAYKKQFPELVVLLCGGDAPYFESNLKARIFVVPELVLIGLNQILRYNV